MITGTCNKYDLRKRAVISGFKQKVLLVEKKLQHDIFVITICKCTRLHLQAGVDKKFYGKIVLMQASVMTRRCQCEDLRPDSADASIYGKTVLKLASMARSC